MAQDRRLRSDEKPNRAIFLAWLAVSTLVSLVAWPKIAEGRMPDPDDLLRLVQVRDLIAGQGWYDLHQYRITPPDGILMHWSRLVDAPLFLSIKALTPLLGQGAAEQVAAFAIPLLVFGMVCLAVGRLAWRLFDAETAAFACLALGIWPLVVMQIQPMRIDHHAYQILAVATALWALAGRSALRSGGAAGVAMGVGAMISLEILPLAAGFGLILLLRWLRDHQQRWWLVCYLKGFALALVLVFAATRGIADLAQHCDAISPAHIGFFVILALGSAAIAAMPRLPNIATLVMLAITGAAGLGFLGMSAPQCLGSPFGEMDPLLREQWYMNVREGLPIWHQAMESAVPAMIQALLAIGAAIAIFTRQRDWQRQWWLEAVLLLVIAVLGGVLTYRSFAFVGVLGAIPIGWLAKQLLARFRSSETIAKKFLSVVLIYLLLVPGAPFAMIKSVQESEAEQARPVGTRESSCDPVNGIPQLNRLPPSVLFAPFDIGPSVLYATPHSVVATGHHRGQKAMRDVIDGFTLPPEKSRAIINRYQADYVVVCTDIFETDNYARMGGAKGLMARLRADDPPTWLQPVEIGGTSALRVWKVRRAETPSPAR